MNLLKPLYYIGLLFSGLTSVFASNSNEDGCYKINCNAGRNSKTRSYNGNIVPNYKTIQDYNNCGLNGIPFTINCDSRLSAFLNLDKCIARTILPKDNCPPVAKGKAYYPPSKGYMDIKDLPNGCNESYKKKHARVQRSIMDGKKGKLCI